MTLPYQMYPAKLGSPETTLTAAITAGATSMTLEDASVLPSAPNIVIIGDDTNVEIVSYTGISGNTVTGLVRGVGDSLASAWNAGTTVARYASSYDHDAFKGNIESLETNKANTSDVNTALALKADASSVYTKTETDTALALKAPLASPAFTGTPTRATTPAVSTNNTELATTAFVHLRGVYHVTGSIAAGTTKTFSNSAIKSSMRVINCVFGTPANVTSNVTWTTVNNSVTFTGTFTGTGTSIDFDLVETDTITVS